MPQSIALPSTPPEAGAPYVVRVNATPVATYEAALAQREVLGQQLERLKRERFSVSTGVGLGHRIDAGANRAGADRAGAEARIVAIDARIAALDKQIEQADLKVAETAAIPGAASGHDSKQRWINEQRQLSENERGGSSDALIAIPVVFFITVLFPLSIAWSRRIWRRGTGAAAALPSELSQRMSRLDQAVESIAIEVERIGEGQRFMTKVLTDNSARSLASAQPVRAKSDR